ncbi:alpha/beta fold hydrolase [Humibacter sp.]|jgi:pimeloyl-ACP methyl ester carboxylesterase|uniref:alpha/beta fold hydrolase n=1 Tax=Humibacter sp. TaxID=1940291 RepID=UPI002C7013FC|nr:alpha/beta fold hydrolase [Humibacter sp.]HVX07701.1 alpha/beta fold hydrolase [Humibacter sp.]
MQLFTREWGAGDRVAVLVHGLFSSSRTWHRLGPDLAERGYRVVAVDLAGHGRSPRLESYSIASLVRSIADTVPLKPELAIGHSLGGLTLSRLIRRLQPGRAVYIDPAFLGTRLPWWQRAGAPMLFRSLLSRGADAVARSNPRWHRDDVEIEVGDYAAFDRRFLRRFGDGKAMPLTPPDRMAVPSLVMLADRSRMVSSSVADRLRRTGFEVRTVAGAGHTVHRDDFAGFRSALSGWV